MNLRQKLLELRKSIVTFAVTAESDKKKANGKESAYRFTPGYVIVETIRKKMDDLGIMLEPSDAEERHEMITYPVYRDYNSEIRTFQKSEMYVTLRVNYTFVDAATGETVGPFTIYSAGANGTDKSIATAISLAERYFLLKYFQITTHDTDEEPDMHDSSDINILSHQQSNRQAPQTVQSQPMFQTQFPSFAQPLHPAVPPTYGNPGKTPSQAPRMQETAKTGNYSPEQLDIYSKAVNALAYFEKDTQSHQNTLNVWMSALARAGFDTSDVTFAATLVQTAQNVRMAQQ